MAIERIEVGGSHRLPRRPAIAGLVSALLVAAVIVQARGHTSTERAAPSPEHTPAAAIRRLDPLAGVPSFLRPKSPQAVGGMLFVSCTHLWGAFPDGSRPHLLLSMAGLSSPTFSPGARTIAFLGGDGHTIWMAGADGSTPTMVGSLSSAGRPIQAKATDLQWSADGSALLFNLVSAGDDPWTTGASTWELRIATGSMTRIATGVSQPTWIDGRLVAASELPSRTGWPTLEPIGPQRGSSASTMAERLSSSADEVLSVGVPPVHWYGVGSETAVTVVGTAGDGLSLALRKDPWNGKPYATVSAPSGERIDTSSRPVVSGDGTFVSIGLIGTDGGPDLGIFNTLTNRWTVRNYAWDPVFSPATPALANTQAVRATSVVRAFFDSWTRNRASARLFVDARVRHALLAFGGVGSAIGTPQKTVSGWAVPATVFGTHGSGSAYRRVVVRVHPQAGRLVVEPAAGSGLHRIRTIPDAVRFLRRTLTVPLAPPGGLPAGTRLAPDPVSAWSWNGHTSGSLRVLVPKPGGGSGIVTFGYDDGGFGCGSSSVPTQIDGAPGDTVTMRAIASGSTPEVIWPAQPGAASAPFSIGGDVPRRILLRMAAATQAGR